MTGGPDDGLGEIAGKLARVLERRCGLADVVVEDARRPGGGHAANMVLFTARYRQSDGTVERRPLVSRMQQVDIRLIPPDEYDLLHEFRVMEQLADSEVRVPPLVLGEADGAELGFPFYIMGHVDGRVVQDHPPYHVHGWIQDLTPEQRARHWNNGVDMLARLHAIDPWERFGFLDRPELGPTGLDQSLRWMQDWYRWICGGERHEVLDAAMAYIVENRPAHHTDSVLWGDARIGNILFDVEGEVNAIIDWELASLGPGELDLGYWIVMDFLLGPGVFLERLEGLPGREETIARYERTLGRPVGDIRYYEIFGALRFALVLLRVEKLFQAAGRLPAESRFGRGSHAVHLLAELLGLRPPTISRDILVRQRPDLPDDFDVEAVSRQPYEKEG
ncbi:phosphotransferase family protein [Streptomyces blattellae]|uniref:phosphotransferase family protein n=1 Tax=Streptomyces blattellae TaxID=2569855 RepID=UPI0012B88141|nr:phosphotransferase family protein [Streptomyces blattellae]